VVEETSVLIRPCDASEGARLKEIAIASKGFWGYEPERVREWADSGDFSSQRMREMNVFVAESGGRVVAWAGLIPRGDVAWLEDLWVEPDWIGKGVGGRLFRHAAEQARQGGATTMEWEAEPNALGFYERMGGKPVRESVSEWGRTLSVMAVEL
jgi:GNAT superfamily N-acetyltransferase